MGPTFPYRLSIIVSSINHRKMLSRSTAESLPTFPSHLPLDPRIALKAHFPPRFTLRNRQIHSQSDGCDHTNLLFLPDTISQLKDVSSLLKSRSFHLYLRYFFASFRHTHTLSLSLYLQRRFEMQEQATSSLAASSLPSSSERSSSSNPHLEIKEGFYLFDHFFS